MFRNPHIHMKIATTGRGFPRFAFPAHAHGLTVMNAGGNFDNNRSLKRAASAAIALVARLIHRGPLAHARWAGVDHLKHAAESALKYLAASAAGGAYFAFGSGLGTSSGTYFADILSGEGHFALAALRDIPECYFHLCFKVKSTGLPSGLPPISAHHAAENIVKQRRNIIILHVLIIMHRGTAEAIVTVLIIAGSFIRIGEYLIGLGRFLEARFGFLITRIFIRVKKQCGFPVCPLYFIRRCGSGNRQNLVVITFGWHLPVLALSGESGLPLRGPGNQIFWAVQSSPSSALYGRRAVPIWNTG